jgi:hypothetical protein
VDRQKPESAVVRQIMIGLIVVALGGLAGVAIFGHGWSQELNLIIASLALAGVAVVMPKLSRWLRARWGPEAR